MVLAWEVVMVSEVVVAMVLEVMVSVVVMELEVTMVSVVWFKMRTKLVMESAVMSRMRLLVT